MAAATAVTRDVLWSATLGAASLTERLEAAGQHGYRGLTVWAADLAQLRAAGTDPADVRRRAADLGVRLVLEGFCEWYPHDPAPPGFTAAGYGYDDQLAAVEAFGCTDVAIVAPLRATEPATALTERFATACDRFATVGAAVHLEFTPFRPIASLAAAWEIVADAGRANGGILFDTWHFFRGSADLDLLRSVPGERIFSVQVSDGAADLVESLLADTLHHRRLPGAGVFDLVGVLGVLRETGGLRMVGPEVLSVELDALPPADAAGLAARALDRVLALV